MFKTTKEKAKREMARRIKRASYQNSPEKWLVERFGEDEKLLRWDAYGGYDGHKWDGTPNPFLTAFEALGNQQWCGIEAGTGVGKTYMLPRIIYWFLDVFPNSLVVTTAPKKEQLRRVLWTEMQNAFPKFKKIRPHAEIFTLNLVVDSRTKKFNKMQKSAFNADKTLDVGHEAIGIVAGVGAGEESATKMQGFHREHMLFVVDELPGIHPSVLTAIINTCSDPYRNLIMGVGNPDSILDALHTFCLLNHTEHVIISGQDHPNVVNGSRLISGAVTQESIDFRKLEYGENSSLFQSRVRGIAPEEASGSIIKAKWVDKCTFGHDSFADIEEDHDYYNSVGVDVANSENGDMASTIWGKGNVCEEIHEFQCPNANHLAYNLIMDDYELESNGYDNFEIPTIELYDIDPINIGIDGVGVGVATVNTLTDLGYACTSLLGGQLEIAMTQGLEGEMLYQFLNLRAQMWFEAREDLRTEQVILNISDKRKMRQLKKELITPLLIVKGGKIRVESKEEIKKRLGGKSPNLADAFIYWNWMRKGHYNDGGFMPFL